MSVVRVQLPFCVAYRRLAIEFLNILHLCKNVKKHSQFALSHSSLGWVSTGLTVIFQLIRIIVLFLGLFRWKKLYCLQDIENIMLIEQKRIVECLNHYQDINSNYFIFSCLMNTLNWMAWINRNWLTSNRWEYRN